MVRIRAVVALAVVVLVATAAAGVPPATSAAAAVTCPSPAPAERVILTIGDSITEGATMAGSVSAGYRAELGRLLDAACIPNRMVVAAMGGTTCGYWTSRMASLVTTHRPDLIILNCGTNNRLDNASADTVAAFESTYRALLDTALDLDPDVVVWPTWVQYSAGRATPACTTPPGPSPSWLPASEARVNDAIYRAVRVVDEFGKRVPGWIDLQSIPEGYLDACGVHPTEGGYAVMARLIFNAIAASLVSPPSAPLPCGLTGRRPGGAVPNWTPCEQMGINQ
ncbi:SGNH/GDSL hydrolase family protein [Micromonospora lupini]|uniref:SGNH/GDSL hydrolase family protein n=1 Tax=Micromonospora lupini TaxID=285679 RepID=UPI002259E52C|nr:SGNH/GDSL hydrolase family protein [Micromonospora lupini]MCX5066894.1 SGNH/GDSL hydrolase family protein [Micromonospora lupini]